MTRVLASFVKQMIDCETHSRLEAELYLPPATSPKVIFMQKPCGRNEIIALIITLALGKHMTRKQVSSHLQVVRQRKRMNAEGEFPAQGCVSPGARR